jgi:hypothetical protein
MKNQKLTIGALKTALKTPGWQQGVTIYTTGSLFTQARLQKVKKPTLLHVGRATMKELNENCITNASTVPTEQKDQKYKQYCSFAKLFSSERRICKGAYRIRTCMHARRKSSCRTAVHFLERKRLSQ